MQFPKNNINKIVSELKKEVKMIGLVAPSFIANFKYPSIIFRLRKLGFDKVTELTFGAKLVNREYHKKLKNSKKLLIATPCPGIVDVIVKKYPQYKDNLIKVDSPMVATAKICKKYYPKHKTCFISPCNYKKIEAEVTPEVDYVIDYSQLKQLFKKYKIKKIKGDILFNKFYNDYTKIYPISGGLGKTAHLKGVVKKDEVLTIDGIKNVMKFLENPDPKIKFLDVLFCKGGCIGGPYTSKLPILLKKRKILKYLKKSKTQDIPENKKGILKKASGIKFASNKMYWDK
ncbi:MAG: [Fe-Fe] hydrogenase large subunit C-terminal domain-containing protein [archaeon]